MVHASVNNTDEICRFTKTDTIVEKRLLGKRNRPAGVGGGEQVIV